MDLKSGSQKLTQKVLVKSGPPKCRPKGDPKSGSQKWTPKVVDKEKIPKVAKLHYKLPWYLQISAKKYKPLDTVQLFPLSAYIGLNCGTLQRQNNGQGILI